MSLFFHRPRLTGNVYHHILAPTSDLNGGAEEFVFQTPFALPVTVFRGAARLAGQFKAVARPALALAPTGAPQGIPQQFSDFYMQNVEAISNE